MEGETRLLEPKRRSRQRSESAGCRFEGHGSISERRHRSRCRPTAVLEAGELVLLEGGGSAASNWLLGTGSNLVAASGGSLQELSPGRNTHQLGCLLRLSRHRRLQQEQKAARVPKAPLAKDDGQSEQTDRVVC